MPEPTHDDRAAHDVDVCRRTSLATNQQSINDQSPKQQQQQQQQRQQHTLSFNIAPIVSGAPLTSAMYLAAPFFFES
jgi:hypothetical protein